MLVNKTQITAHDWNVVHAFIKDLLMHNRPQLSCRIAWIKASSVAIAI